MAGDTTTGGGGDDRPPHPAAAAAPLAWKISLGAIILLRHPLPLFLPVDMESTRMATTSQIPLFTRAGRNHLTRTGGAAGARRRVRRFAR